VYVPYGRLIQLPWIQLQRARGTISVPDRSTLLLGGLKRITDRDLSASTPFMEKIPLLGVLFRRQGKGVEKECLLILVRPTIIDLTEVEQEIE
jgi:type II secretory pathway component GspD/PulD (secretin)